MTTKAKRCAVCGRATRKDEPWWLCTEHAKEWWQAPEYKHGENSLGASATALAAWVRRVCAERVNGVEAQP